MTDRIDLPQGTLDLLILRTLALEPLHGWAISERIQAHPSDFQQGFIRAAGLTVPCAPSTGAQGLDQGTLGRIGKQPPRQVL